MPRSTLTAVLVFAAIFLRVSLVLLTYDHLRDDAALYNDTGRDYAWSAIHGTPTPDAGLKMGTDAYAKFTSFVYMLFGSHPAVMMLLNTTLAGIGSFIFYSLIWSLYPRAHIAIKAFALLDPSMIFWTSTHGKDPIMFFLLAVCCWSFFRLVHGSKKAVAVYFIGLAAMCLIRPHIAIVIALSGMIVLAVRFRKANPAMKTALLISALGVVGIGSLIFSVYLDDMPDTPLIDKVSISLAALSDGGSSMDVDITSWPDLFTHAGEGLIAVLFRPFPWEASSASIAAAAVYRIPLITAEILAILYFVQKRRAPRRPFVKFCGFYCLFLVLFFAVTTANIGTLERERVQLMPFLLLLVAARSSRVRVLTFREEMPSTDSIHSRA